MKKILFTAIFITLITSAAFCQSGVIKELTGEVELKKAGTNSFVQANTGDTVAANTIISTGFRSTAIIAVGSSVITVCPLTRLSLAEIQSAENSEKVNVNLQAGRVRVEVKPPAGTKTNLNVQSPSATASVRGTTFEMDTQNLNGIEGKVMLTGNLGAPVIVTGGNSSTSTIDRTVSNPVVNAEQSVHVQQPVGSNNDSIRPKPAKGELIINVEYSSNKD